MLEKLHAVNYYILIMTSLEKQNTYNLLKSASSWILGYESPEFKKMPDFKDDTITVIESTSLSDIAAQIHECRNCILGTLRTNAVPGEGYEQPYVMVIGEGPGEDEDKTGRPFVGKAGQLLDKMLASICLDRKCNCFIANIVKCRPPHNRTPLPEEADSCIHFLKKQIETAHPKMILAMGRTAVQNLLNTSEGINALRGKFMDYNGIPLMATYHPSALLRNESLKRPAWEDLKAFRAKMEELMPEYKDSFNAMYRQA